MAGGKADTQAGGPEWEGECCRIRGVEPGATCPGWHSRAPTPLLCAPLCLGVLVYEVRVPLVPITEACWKDQRNKHYEASGYVYIHVCALHRDVLFIR